MALPDVHQEAGGQGCAEGSGKGGVQGGQGRQGQVEEGCDPLFLLCLLCACYRSDAMHFPFHLRRRCH